MKTGTIATPVRLPGIAATAPLAHSLLLAELTEVCLSVTGDAGRALRLARSLGPLAPRMSEGHTGEILEILATAAAVDLTAARVVEAHLDALGILSQNALEPETLFAGTPVQHQAWGVFAAEAPGHRLTAAQQRDGTWHLDGTKPWCSLAGGLTQALVTARTSDTHRRLFAVDLIDPGVVVRSGGWVAVGLPGVPSCPVDFTHVDAVPIGPDDWYLTRPGFAWGGIGVAACWYGGAVGVARRLTAGLHERDPDELALAQLGAVDVLLSACATTLASAARAIDEGAANGTAGTLLAARVRGLVARTVEEVISRVGHALGPAPLAFDARHTQRVADLQLYVRQHHAERDDAALGKRLLSDRRVTLLATPPGHDGHEATGESAGAGHGQSSAPGGSAGAVTGPSGGEWPW